MTRPKYLGKSLLSISLDIGVSEATLRKFLNGGTITDRTRELLMEYIKKLDEDIRLHQNQKGLLEKCLKEFYAKSRIS